MGADGAKRNYVPSLDEVLAATPIVEPGRPSLGRWHKKSSKPAGLLHIKSLKSLGSRLR